MLNRFKKIIVFTLTFILITILFSYTVNAVPSNSEDDSNASNNENTTEPTNLTDDENSESEGNTVNNNSDEENKDQAEIRSTSGTNNNTSKIPNSPALDESQSISSYSTVATLPEANLGLNNILNVILIALGILMVLLGIAILIKMKS